MQQDTLPAFSAPSPETPRLKYGDKDALLIVVFIVSVVLIGSLLVIKNDLPGTLFGFDSQLIVGWAIAGLTLVVLAVGILFQENILIMLKLRQPQLQLKGRVAVIDSTFFFPDYLLFGKTRGDARLRQKLRQGVKISQIVEFFYVPSYRNSPAYFQLIVKFEGCPKTREVKFFETIGDAQVSKLFEALHSASGLNDEVSPFSHIARAGVLRERRVQLLLALLIPAAITSVAISTIVVPFGHPKSAILTLSIWASVAGFFASVLLYPKLMLGTLKQLRYRGLYATGFCICASAFVLFGLIMCHLIQSGPTQKVNFSIERKRAVRYRNGVGYHVELRLPAVQDLYLLPIQEFTSVRLKKADFEKVVVGRSALAISLQNGLLGFPVIAHFKLIDREK